MKSLKLTFNAINNKVIETILPLIMDIVIKFKDDNPSISLKDLSLKIVDTITHYEGLIKEFCNNGMEEETYLIEETEIYCGRDRLKYFGNLFHVIV